MLTGGIKFFYKFLRNINALESGYNMNSRNFGYGYLVNISNIINIFSLSFTGAKINEILAKILSISILLISVVFSFIADRYRKKIFVLTTCIIWVPGFSYMYTVLYFVIPLAFFLKEEKGTVAFSHQMNKIYAILFGVLFSLAPYGYIFMNLPGKNKISFSMILVTVSIFFIFLLESVHTIDNSRKHCIIESCRSRKSSMRR